MIAVLGSLFSVPSWFTLRDGWTQSVRLVFCRVRLLCPTPAALPPEQYSRGSGRSSAASRPRPARLSPCPESKRNHLRYSALALRRYWLELPRRLFESG